MYSRKRLPIFNKSPYMYICRTTVCVSSIVLEIRVYREMIRKGYTRGTVKTWGYKQILSLRHAVLWSGYIHVDVDTSYTIVHVMGWIQYRGERRGPPDLAATGTIISSQLQRMLMHMLTCLPGSTLFVQPPCYSSAWPIKICFCHPWSKCKLTYMYPQHENCDHLWTRWICQHCKWTRVENLIFTCCRMMEYV